MRHAAAHSPLYRDLYAGVDLDANFGPADLPTVDKGALVDRFADWTTDRNLGLEALERHVDALGAEDELLAGRFRVMPTGGTSGHRAIHVFDEREWIECLAAFMRWSDLMGLRPRVPRLRIATVTAVGARHMTSRFGMSIDVGMHRTLRLDAARPSASFAAQLEDFQPDVVIGFASRAWPGPARPSNPTCRSTTSSRPTARAASSA